MSDPLQPLLIAVPIVVLACQAGGRAMRRLGQPPVLGEILAGIALGPSLLGWLAPALQHHVLPTAALSTTSAIGNIALIVFLFLIGLELDLTHLRSARSAVAAVSLASVLVPLGLGAALATAMYPALAPPGVARAPFTLFIAVALAITAFPVLARILADRGLQTTRLGAFTLTCAALDDALAWCLLTAAVALSSSHSPLSALSTLGKAATFAAALIALRPLWHRALARAARAGDELVLALLFAAMCLSAYATDSFGIHPIFGAFLAGVTAPRALPAVERSAARLRAVVLPALLPLYFVDTGLHTDFGSLASGQWAWAAAILLVAVVGKWSAAAGAARLAGFDWRWSATVGTLMTCRGLTELVVLGVGLQIGIITGSLYTLLVLMALVTTAATGPVLDLLTRGNPHLTPIAAPAPAVEGTVPESTG